MNLKSLCNLSVFLLLSFATGTSFAQKNYLQNSYAAKGGASLLSNIDSWKSSEKQYILQQIKDLPEPVKKDFIAIADQSLTTAWSQIRLSDYQEFKNNGNRVNYEALNFSRRSKLSALCIGELIEGKGRYLTEIANGLWLIMEESTWVLPAHLYGTNPEGPDPAAPIIDLFAAETAAHMTWIRLLLQEQLDGFSPVLIQRIDRELETRIIKPYMATDGFWWMGFDGKKKQNNWNIWINSNLLKVAALADKDPERRTAMIEKVIRSADKFIDKYPADGGCDEGPAYWDAAGGCLGDFITILTRISGGKLDWKDSELIHNIGSYIYKAHIDGRRFMNFADAPGLISANPARVFNFGELYNDDKLKSFAAYMAKISGPTGRFMNPGSINAFANNVRVFRELTTLPATAPMPKQNWLPDLQILNLRETEGSSKGLSFMAKAGHNGESHNHNDVGNFMLYMDGEPVIIDLGKGTYTKQTFSADRYKLWYIQSQWHNCPAVNGIDQQAGEKFAARNVRYKAGNATDVFSMDLAGVYPKNAGVKSWNREFVYNRKDGELLLKEKYELLKYIAPSTLNFVACKQPVKEREGLIRLPSFSGKSAITMEYNPDHFAAHIVEQPVDDGSLAAVWGKTVYRVTLTYKNESLRGGQSIRFKKTAPASAKK